MALPIFLNASEVAILTGVQEFTPSIRPIDEANKGKLSKDIHRILTYAAHQPRGLFQAFEPKPFVETGIFSISAQSGFKSASARA